MSHPPALPESASVHTPNLHTRQRRLTQAELGLMLALTAEGKTQVEIAQRLDCDQSAISHALRKLGGDSTELATHHFKARSFKTARRLTSIVEKSGDEDAVIKAAKVVLAASGVTEQVKGNASIAIQVNVGMPGQPAGPDPLAGMTITTEAKVIGESSQEGRG